MSEFGEGQIVRKLADGTYRIGDVDLPADATPADVERALSRAYGAPPVVTQAVQRVRRIAARLRFR